MNNEPERIHQPGNPAVSRRRWRISLVWLVPAIAALVGLSMLAHTWLSAGPEITIAFRTAAGLEAGKTPVKYKDVTVGTVTAIALSDDGSHVVATVSLTRSAESLTRSDTRFWVVRPRIGTGGISGIDTLLSGAYIAADAGSEQASSKVFTGLETPPTVIGGMPGKSFVLHTEDLGSLDVGSPVYYRRIQVGRVASYKLDDDGNHVSLQVFIDKPYDSFVTTDTRFWNASGVDVSLGADGLKLKTQSVATIVAGGIAFAASARGKVHIEQAPENTQFILAPDQASAMAEPDGPEQFVQLRFDQSLRGLSLGAPVQFSGVDLGKVVSINLDYDPSTFRFPTTVGIVVYPQRLGRLLDKLPGTNTDQQAAQFLRELVEHGLRAQARSGNLLTGQLYVSLEFVPNAPKRTIDVSARPLSVPTISGSFDQLQGQVASIVGKIEKMPLDSIGRNLDSTLAELDKTLKQVNSQTLPQTTRTLLQAQQAFGAAQGVLAEDAPLQQNLGQTLQEVQRVSRSLRVLTDMLGRHPESLLRGRPDSPSPPATGKDKTASQQESRQ
ncbi:MlaD family protein [Klebsiella pneumoniae]|uniref:PqiB family protein n=1 Tax=Klebsiella pneumoniae TaxID=573 RepID=UPI0021D84C9F|nr:MlaD family protein [Klebsiella pneumoniae]ELY2785164.1 MCE family protein [Cronobacter turicensis]MCU8675179.1 MlaD family protein [Klebsiella pneumoniae]MCU8688538.1 MlaD family protein [Klebsiella pneumoniae]HCB0101311.1 MCE family protein [Klebsiella pneumoniae]